MSVSKEENILSKYTERLASERAAAIDNFVSRHIPSWKQKIMLLLPFTRKHFGYEIVQYGGGYKKPKVELKKHGKLLGTLIIKET